MEISAILAGTGFDNRAARIRMFAKAGTPVELRREPDNPHDENAIAVFLPVRRWYTLFRAVPIQIGYIKRGRAASLASKMDDGVVIRSAMIHSLSTERDHPRVSLRIQTDE